MSGLCSGISSSPDCYRYAKITQNICIFQFGSCCLPQFGVLHVRCVTTALRWNMINDNTISHYMRWQVCCWHPHRTSVISMPFKEAQWHISMSSWTCWIYILCYCFRYYVIPGWCTLSAQPPYAIKSSSGLWRYTELRVESVYRKQ